MADSSEKTPRENRSTTPISEAFRVFIQTGWAPAKPAQATPWAQVAQVHARRDRLSADFPGVSLIIPAGVPKQRSNDTDYPFRPHSAFAYLTGWGSRTTPGSILLGSPADQGHSWALYVSPPAPRTSDEFYANPAIGEFWTGRRPGLEDVGAWMDTPTRDLALWSLDAVDVRASALIQEADPALTRELRDARGVEDSSGDDHLAEVISEMRLVKDDYEIAELKAAIAATHRGFQDIVDALPEALSHPRGERVIEGAFQARARAEGNDVGYATIAASGHHACILHWVSNDGPLTPGDLLLVDAGVERDSLYTADITRTFPVSGTFSPEQRQVYDAVLEAADAALAAVKPGAIFRDIHQAAMAVIATKVSQWGLLPVGLEEALAPEGQHHRRYMIHGTSHHLGLDVHDCAHARREMYLEGELRPGMVFTIEPGLYFQPDDETVPPQWRGVGVRIEDNILVTDTGAVNLSAAIPRTAGDIEAWLGA
jgi:Xaa-Pro aminopeptidase